MRIDLPIYKFSWPQVKRPQTTKYINSVIPITSADTIKLYTLLHRGSTHE